MHELTGKGRSFVIYTDVFDSNRIEMTRYVCETQINKPEETTLVLSSTVVHFRSVPCTCPIALSVYKYNRRFDAYLYWV